MHKQNIYVPVLRFFETMLSQSLEENTPILRWCCCWIWELCVHCHQISLWLRSVQLRQKTMTINVRDSVLVYDLESQCHLPVTCMIKQCSYFTAFVLQWVAVLELSISAPTTALRYCIVLNLRCSALHWHAVENDQYIWNAAMLHWSINGA